MSVYKYWFESLLLILLSVYLGVGLLDPTAILYNFWRHYHTVFYSGCTILHSPSAMHKRSPFLYILINTDFPFFFLDNDYTNGAFCIFLRFLRDSIYFLKWRNIGKSMNSEDSSNELETQLCFFLFLGLYLGIWRFPG